MPLISSGTQYAATGRPDHLIANAANDSSAHRLRGNVENALNRPALDAARNAGRA